MANEKKAVERKVIRLEPVPGSSLCRFAWNGGGELPVALSGSYTGPAMAYQALTAYNLTQSSPVKLEDRAGPQSKPVKGL